MAGSVGLGAALLGPQQRVSLRFQNHDHCAGAVVVCLVVEAGRPVRDVADEPVLRAFELNHPDFRSLDVKIIADFDLFRVGDEIGFPDRLQADGVKILTGGEIVIFALKPIGKSIRAIEDEFCITVKIHGDRRGGYRHEPDRLSAAVHQSMPAIERRGKQTKRPPFEQPRFSTILPDFGGAMTGENTNHFFVEMALGVKRAARRNLGDVHSGLPLHAVEMNKSAATAHAAPGTKLQFAHILDAKALHDRNAFALHPLAVAGAIQRSQHLFEFGFHDAIL